MKEDFFMTLYIKVGSITNAQRSQRSLRQKGYKSIIKKLENSEHTHQAKHTHHQQSIGCRKNKSQIRRKSGKKINNAKKTERIFPRLLGTI